MLYTLQKTYAAFLLWESRWGRQSRCSQRVSNHVSKVWLPKIHSQICAKSPMTMPGFARGLGWAKHFFVQPRSRQCIRCQKRAVLIRMKFLPRKLSPKGRLQFFLSAAPATPQFLAGTPSESMKRHKARKNFGSFPKLHMLQLWDKTQSIMKNVWLVFLKD